MEPSYLGLHCLQKVYKLVSSTNRVKPVCLPYKAQTNRTRMLLHLQNRQFSKFQYCVISDMTAGKGLMKCECTNETKFQFTRFTLGTLNNQTPRAKHCSLPSNALDTDNRQPVTYSSIIFENG